MMAGGAWSDLLPRLGTAVILMGVAAGALWIGGVVFKCLLLIAVTLMHWELGQMLNPMSRQSGRFAASFAAFTFLLAFLSGSWWWALIWMILGAAIQPLFFYAYKRSGFIVSLAIFFTGFVLISLRDNAGLGSGKDPRKWYSQYKARPRSTKANDERDIKSLNHYL